MVCGWRELAAVGWVAGMVVATVARAQVAAPVPVPDLTQPAEAPEKLSVSQRPNPDYDPLGIRAGSFVINPSLDLGEAYNSNIYGAHSDAKSDFITLITPAIDIASDWGVHALALHAEGDIKEYADHGTEDVGDMVAQADGRLDILRGQYLELGAGYQIQTEDRASPDSIEATELAGGGAFAKYPTQYTVETGRFAYVYSPARIGIEVDGTLNAYQFSNEPTLNGGLAINSDRSRNEYTLAPKVSYEIEPGYQAFAQVTGNWRDYNSTFDATPEHYKRSSAGYTVAVGTEFDIDRLITGQFWIGYQDQMYEDPRLSDLRGADFGGSALWNVTELNSLKLAVSRSVQETIVVGASGFWDTEVDFTAEHELLRNLLLTGGATYINSDYQGAGLTTDEYGIKAGAVWKLNRNTSVGVSAAYLDQTASQSIEAYDQELFQLDLKLQF